jgi:hypothetical protein
MSHSHLVCIEGDYAYNFQTKELDAIYKNKKTHDIKTTSTFAKTLP